MTFPLQNLTNGFVSVLNPGSAPTPLPAVLAFYSLKFITAFLLVLVAALVRAFLRDKKGVAALYTACGVGTTAVLVLYEVVSALTVGSAKPVYGSVRVVFFATTPFVDLSLAALLLSGWWLAKGRRGRVLRMKGMPVALAVGQTAVVFGLLSFLPRAWGVVEIVAAETLAGFVFFASLRTLSSHGEKRPERFQSALLVLLFLCVPAHLLLTSLFRPVLSELFTVLSLSSILVYILYDTARQLRRARRSAEHMNWANEEVQQEMEERQWAETQLQESRRFAESIVETIREPLLVLDAEFKILKVNRSYCQLFQVDAEEVLFQNFLTLSDSRWQCEELVEAIRQTVLTGKHFEDFELSQEFPGIGRRTILLSGRPIYQTEMDCNLVLLTMSDITAQKTAQEESRRLIRGIESAAESILMTDAEERIQYANPAFVRLLGCKEEEVLGQKLQAFLQNPGSPEESYHEIAQSVSRGDVWSGEISNSMNNGKLRDFQVTIAPVFNGNTKVDGLVAILNDITSLKQAEEELARHAEELARSNAELEQFAYIASHDLQEPLRMVSSYCQLLKKRYYDKLDENACDFIDYAVDGAQRMQVLINDLLAYSRVGTRGQPFAPTDCNQIMQSVTNNLKIAIDESGADIKYSELPVVLGDETQLLQLLQNLVGNAIKFRKDKPPKVQVTAKLRKHSWVFSVKDNGIGIEPEFRDRIFEIFQRLHGKDAYPGTGIGLAICKKIVERHGGSIWFDSTPGKGSTFYFTLPDFGKVVL